MRAASHSRGIGRSSIWAVALGALAAAGLAAGAEPHYHLIKSNVLGGASGWDYISLDPETHRLFITRGTHVMVVNAGNGRLVGDIDGMKGIHGVAFAHRRGYGQGVDSNRFDPATGLAFSSNGGSGTLT